MEQVNLDFQKYYFENWKLAFYTAFQILNNTEAAEDVASDVFIKLYEYMLDGRPPISKIEAWIVISVKRKAIDYIRKNERLVPLNNDIPCKNLFKDLENHILASDILNRLFNKNERWFDIFEKYYVLEMSTSEIAIEYGCSEQAIRNALHRAKKYLRKEFQLLDIIFVIIMLYFYF